MCSQSSVSESHDLDDDTGAEGGSGHSPRRLPDDDDVRLRSEPVEREGNCGTVEAGANTAPAPRTTRRRQHAGCSRLTDDQESVEQLRCSSSEYRGRPAAHARQVGRLWASLRRHGLMIAAPPNPINAKVDTRTERAILPRAAIDIPVPGITAAGDYTPATRAGDLVFAAGHLRRLPAGRAQARRPGVPLRSGDQSKRYVLETKTFQAATR